MSNEELFYLLQKFYPGTLNGTHYLTGHQLDTGGNQVGEAFISNWKLPQPEPSPEQLLSWWYEHMVEVRQSVKAFHARDKRDGLLLDADAAVYKAEDAGDAAKVTAARQYRQALRDVPQQPGFPDVIEWPVAPV